MVWSIWRAGKQASEQMSETTNELTVKQANRKVSGEVIELGAAGSSISRGRKKFGLAQLSIFWNFFRLG